MWDSDAAYDNFMGRFSSRLAPLFADFAGVTAGERVLDVGAGTGMLTQELVRRGAVPAAIEPAPAFAESLRRRFPDLDVVFAEVDFGWVPYAKEQIDNNYQRLEPLSRFGLQAPPSEYIERHFHFGFMTDTFGIHSREYVGVERILWSNDYPHISADWPTSWRTIQSAFSGVPADERRAILAGNAQRLYGFGS